MKNLTKMILMAAAPAAMMTAAAPAQAGDSTYLGELTLVGMNFCPRGTFEAAGQLLPIANWSALFSLLGTTYGGDGRTSFGLPDLRGRTPVGFGNQPGVSPVNWGQKGGWEFVALNVNNLPMHTHTGELRGENSVLADSKNPSGNALALAGEFIYSDNSPPKPEVALNAGSVVLGTAGSSTQFGTRDPYLGMRFCINNTGSYPPRS